MGELLCQGMYSTCLFDCPVKYGVWEIFVCTEVYHNTK